MTAEINSMLEKARAAMKNAYAPYSNFHVGVCLRTHQNNYYVGCNYENASYSLTQCAESTAIGGMINAGEQDIAEIVIIGSSEQACTPCGACRQRIREFATPKTMIHMFGTASAEALSMTLAELLPVSFGPQLKVLTQP